MSALLTPPMPVALPAPKLLSADEFFEQYGAGGYELIDGIVTEVSMPGFKHGKVALKLSRVVGDFVEAHDLGHAAGNDTLFQLRRGPDTLRGPDVLFVSYAKQPADDVPDGPLKVIPELVFEVRSPSDPWTEVLEKVLDYLKAGVAVVVVLDPKTSTASVFRPNDLQDIFAADQTLTIPDVLPGFAVAVGMLFG
jgi:Uma2 family endonuclease